MKRRSFLKSAAVLSTAGFITPAIATATTAQVQEQSSTDGRRRFTLVQTYDVKAPEGSSGVVKLWIPVPEETHFQQLRKLTFNGNYKDAYITADNS